MDSTKCPVITYFFFFFPIKNHEDRQLRCWKWRESKNFYRFHSWHNGPILLKMPSSCLKNLKKSPNYLVKIYRFFRFRSTELFSQNGCKKRAKPAVFRPGVACKISPKWAEMEFKKKNDLFEGFSFQNLLEPH